MSPRTFQVTAGAVFLLIAVGHLLRVFLGGTLVVMGVAIPMWPSIVAVVVMGYLSFEAFHLARRP